MVAYFKYRLFPVSIFGEAFSLYLLLSKEYMLNLHKVLLFLSQERTGGTRNVPYNRGERAIMQTQVGCNFTLLCFYD